MKRAIIILSLNLGYFLAPEGFSAASAQQVENPFDAMTDVDDLADVIRDGRAILQQRLEEARRREAASGLDASDRSRGSATNADAGAGAGDLLDTSGWLVFQIYIERPPYRCKYPLFGLGAGYDPAEALARARQRDTRDAGTCGIGEISCRDDFVTRCQAPGWFAVGMSSVGTGLMVCGKGSRDAAVREAAKGDSGRSYFLSGFFTGVIDAGAVSVLSESENATFRDMIEEDLDPEWDPGADC